MRCLTYTDKDMIKNFSKNNKAGYTLLFAVLVSSLVLAIGISILTISKKEFLLATSARESTSAFYSADSGLECAIYHDNGANFSTSTPEATTVSCAGFQPTVNYEAVNTFGADGGVFSFDIKLSNGACSIVTVDKTYYNSPTDSPDAGYVPRTTITSKGYNIGWDTSGNTGCNQPSPRRVERALKLVY
jgi:hypothetical protein